MVLASTLERHLGARAVREGVLVAWSGGLDSTVLLHLLLEWGHRTGAEVGAVHVDHQLRSSSRVDRAFCQKQASRWGVPLVVETLEVRRQGSVQESARLQRYAAIARAAQRMGLGVVITAHHADDAIETALLNFRRGSAAGGLSAGVSPTDAPIPGWPDLALIRPLVRVSKQAIRAHANEHGIKWCSDPTNADTGYERNRLRKSIVPTLTDQGALTAPILATLENLASEHRGIEELADEAFERARLAAPDAESLAFDCEALRETPQAVVAALLKKVAHTLPNEASFGRDHLWRLTDAVMNEGQTARVSARGVVATIERDLLLVEVARGRGGRDLHDRIAEPIALARDIKGCEAPWFGTSIRLQRSANSPATSSPTESPPRGELIATIRLTGQLADESLVVRGARAGDRLDAHAMSGHKAVGALLAEAGVPRPLRWRWPVVALGPDQSQVIWVCGLRRSAQTHENTGSIGDTRLCWRLGSATFFARILARVTR